MTPARDAVEGVLLNTSGGLTGGDTLDVRAEAGAGSCLRLTTQAAERVYRSSDGRTARVRNHVIVGGDARVEWLPQETILFQHGRLRRTLTVEMAADGTALIVEPVIFGREAMGETVTEAALYDRVEVYRDGDLIFRDASDLSGDVTDVMAHGAVGRDARAMALIVYAAPDAETHLEAVRTLLPPFAGISMIRNGFLVMRVLAHDGFDLRQVLLPVLDRLTKDRLPRSWRL